jgi:hypothetical protein
MSDVLKDWRRWSHRERIGAMLLVVVMISATVSGLLLTVR